MPRAFQIYKEEFIRQAYVACSTSGMTQKQLGVLFGVHERRIRKWMTKYPEFKEAVKGGGDEYDSGTAETCLKKRVEGYNWIEQTEEYDADDNLIKKKIVNKHVPPDTHAIIKFLFNRSRDRWRDRKEVQVDATINVKVIDRFEAIDVTPQKAIEGVD